MLAPGDLMADGQHTDGILFPADQTRRDPDRHSAAVFCHQTNLVDGSRFLRTRRVHHQRQTFPVGRRYQVADLHLQSFFARITCNSFRRLVEGGKLSRGVARVYDIVRAFEKLLLRSLLARPAFFACFRAAVSSLSQSTVFESSDGSLTNLRSRF